ncbi:hypothetical protein H6B10_17270, partial [Gemmiger formicilis]|nr:hypothetical protein [Gemmiger formicilis]
MWYNEAVVYQIYPLGLCGAPLQNSRPKQSKQQPINQCRGGIKHQKLDKPAQRRRLYFA